MLRESAYASLIIQFVTGIIDIYGLSIKVPKDKLLFRDLLKVELGVQTVEFIFYLWMVYNIYHIKNITPYRYLDWFVTTPTMLVTLMAYLDTKSYPGLYSFIQNNTTLIKHVLLLNAGMLVFGLLGEFRIIHYVAATFIGFIPFLYYYYMLHKEYIKEDTSKDKIYLFWFFFVVWSLYGIAAWMPYAWKNTMYNILDLFAKNVFGIFLVYVLWTYRIKQ
jgi:bacteriorhodopsin